MCSYICCRRRKFDFKKIDQKAHFLRFFCEPSRLKILDLLKENRHCVCEIMNHLNFSQSLVSHHLADLKENQLVNSEKVGQRVYYSISKKGEKVISLLEQLKNL